jgi:hypothetical protein
VQELGAEATSLYSGWPERDRLTLDLYAVSEDWAIGLSPQRTQEFIAQVASLSVEELAEELRKAKEAAERKAAIAKKSFETRERQKGLPSEERKRPHSIEFSGRPIGLRC